MTTGLRKGLTNYGDAAFSLFHRKVFIKAMGYSDDALDRPIVGVTNTYSDYNPCHGNVPDLIESVKRGILLAGGSAHGVSHHLHPREFRLSHLDVPAQPHGHGHRRDDPRPADGRRGRHRWLR